jgi:hypothetical protein
MHSVQTADRPYNLAELSEVCLGRTIRQSAESTASTMRRYIHHTPAEVLATACEVLKPHLHFVEPIELVDVRFHTTCPLLEALNERADGPPVRH